MYPNTLAETWVLDDEKTKYEIIAPENIVDTRVIFDVIGIITTKVIYREPYTILFYKACDDNTIRKVIVICKEPDTYNKEIGYEIALLKANRNEIARYLRKFAKN
ncbi:MAG TPA: hypothetical protein GX708_23155 [Gallicola sp.]|nr:hypothetical protein [Gallicola sp.]